MGSSCLQGTGRAKISASIFEYRTQELLVEGDGIRKSERCVCCYDEVVVLASIRFVLGREHCDVREDLF